MSFFDMTQKQKELKVWHTLSNLNNVPNSLLLYIRLVKYADISNSGRTITDESEILRRVKNEIFFYEKQRIYERALCINSLSTLLNMINERRRYSEFSASELHTYASLLKTMRLRNKILSEEMSNAYRHGKKMVTYIENIIFLDYLMNGKSKELEEQHPHLAEKAKEIFGNEFYFSIPTSAEELKNNPKILTKLIERKEEIEEQLDDTLNQCAISN